jgi:hypothetical protein
MFSDHYKRDELHILEEKKKKTAVLVGPVPTCRVFGLRITIFDKTKKCNPGAS